MKKYLGKQKISKKYILTYITDFCNMSCPYCGIKKNENKWTEKNVLRIFSIFNTLENKILPVIHGGEPTTYPNIDILLRFLHIPFIIFTNMTKPYSFFKKLKDNTSIVGLNVSLHRRFVKDTEEFIKKVNMVDKFIPINLNILLEDDDKNYYDLVLEKTTTTEKRLIPIRYNSAVQTSYNRNNYYTFLIEKYNNYPQYSFIEDQDGIQKERFESEFSPDIGILGKVKCDVRSWQRLITSNGDYYSCNRNKTPECYIFEKTDKEIKEMIEDNSDIICDNIPCSLCLMRYGTKEVIE